MPIHIASNEKITSKPPKSATPPATNPYFISSNTHTGSISEPSKSTPAQRRFQRAVCELAGTLEAPLGGSAFAGFADASGMCVAGNEVRISGWRCGGLWWFAGYFFIAGYVDRHFAVHRGIGCGREFRAYAGGTVMSGSRRLLIIGGIALAIWGMSYGLWYAVFAEHQALDNIGSSLARSFAAAADRNPGVMESSLHDYREAKYVYDRQVGRPRHC